jgi:hypothetical protein
MTHHMAYHHALVRLATNNKYYRLTSHPYYARTCVHVLLQTNPSGTAQVRPAKAGMQGIICWAQRGILGGR